MKPSAHGGRVELNFMVTPSGDTGCQKRSPSRSTESSRNPSAEKNRKPRHH